MVGQQANDNYTDQYTETDIEFTCNENGAKDYIVYQTKVARGMEFFFYIYDVTIYED